MRAKTVNRSSIKKIILCDSQGNRLTVNVLDSKGRVVKLPRREDVDKAREEQTPVPTMPCDERVTSEFEWTGWGAESIVPDSFIVENWFETLQT
jgi:hypothetical protein